ncbi:MAG TPA: deoxyribodipyrimidine photo-lyase, partial [Candidatus Dormibacteraeota bacterium]|nr:deoxyribodipyrimidine photo-lyase [Candidatus Dormibacteraeota bacterium]
MHWFRRDLRLFDHQAIAKAGEGGRPVIGLFVLDPAILQSPDTGASRVAYLIGALAELDAALRRLGSALVIRRGSPREVVPAFAAETEARLVTAVRDFEPYARTRDGAVAQMLESDGRSLWLSAEQLLLDPSSLPPLRTFSACRRRFASSLGAGIPPAARTPAFLAARALPRTERLPGRRELGLAAGDRILEPGEPAAARRLTTFVEGKLGGYATARDDPAADATSRLSADLRFGVLSVRTLIRAALEAVRNTPQADSGVRAWLDQLAWRDFYASILWHFPEVATLEYK